MVWVAALPPWLATIGASTASATICSSWPSNRPSTDEARKAVARLTKSQLKRPRAMVQTLSDSSLSLVQLPHVLDGDDAAQPVGGVDHRSRDQIIFAEQPRPLFLVVEHRHPAAVFVD